MYFLYPPAYIWVRAGITVIVVGNKPDELSSNLAEAVYVLFCVYAFGKGMDPSLVP